MDLLSETKKISIIPGQSLIIWIKEKQMHIGQTPVPTI